MKVGAHPMVVAVALGFLGPSALAEDDDDMQGDGLDLCDTCGDVPGSCATDGVVADTCSALDPLDVAAVSDAWASLIG